MVQLGSSTTSPGSQKEQQLKKPIGDTTVVVLPVAPRATAKSGGRFCSKRVVATVSLVALILLLVAAALLGRFLVKRGVAWCGVGYGDDVLVSEHQGWDGQDADGFDTDHYGDRDEDRDGRPHGDRDGDRDGRPHGDRDGDRDGDHDDDRDGDHDDDRDGDREGHPHGDRDGDRGGDIVYRRR